MEGECDEIKDSTSFFYMIYDILLWYRGYRNAVTERREKERRSMNIQKVPYQKIRKERENE